MSGKNSNARLAAVHLLGAVLDKRLSLREAARVQSGLSDRDAAFAVSLAYGVLRWKSALDWLAARMLKQAMKPKDRDVHRLLLIGLFQLWKEDTPDHAAVHATANGARQLNKPWAVGLINAVLRRFQRERDAMISQLAKAPEQHAHPQWLLDQLQKDWPQDWQSIADANNQHAPLWLRINAHKSNRDSVAAALQEQGFAVDLHKHAVHGCSVTPARTLTRIDAFRDGLVSVQDPAAQMAAPLLNPQPGDRVLDACAAPGGKTGHLLEYQPDISLLALERDADRCQLITDNLQRLGLSCDVKTADATQPELWWDKEPFDRILLDAPCSATGVIRRHPEIKWLRSPEQVESAVEQQKALLEQLWPLLKRGGILLYATCSVLKCENHEQIQEFLSRHSDAELVPSGPDGEQPWQIFPGQEAMDGFFYATLRKPD